MVADQDFRPEVERRWSDGADGEHAERGDDPATARARSRQRALEVLERSGRLIEQQRRYLDSPEYQEIQRRADECFREYHERKAEEARLKAPKSIDPTLSKTAPPVIIPNAEQSWEDIGDGWQELRIESNPETKLSIRGIASSSAVDRKQSSLSPLGMKAALPLPIRCDHSSAGRGIGRAILIRRRPLISQCRGFGMADTDPYQSASSLDLPASTPKWMV
jgi:hypothetical protein